MTETKRLGRGLEALLGPVSREQAEASGTLRELPITQVHPNPYQPRTRIDEPALAELAESMEASGLLQPVVVRSQGGAYELIAGDRRLGEEFHLGHAEIARVVGRNRSTVANLLRLLQLPDEVQAMLHDGRLSEGHGRALLG